MSATILQPRRRLSAVAQTFVEQGLPSSITLDRDTCWVGSPQGSDFPADLVSFCRCLGVAVLICDPHHPQQNSFGFVERYHRTLNQECLKRHRPMSTVNHIVHQQSAKVGKQYTMRSRERRNH